jgi:hypothetical protein
MLDDRGIVVLFPARVGFFLPQNDQTTSGAYPVCYSMGKGVLSPWIRRPGHETYHSPQPIGKVKNGWRYLATLPYALMACRGTPFPYYWSTRKVKLHVNRFPNLLLFPPPPPLLDIGILNLLYWNLVETGWRFDVTCCPLPAQKKPSCHCIRTSKLTGLTVDN